jgi:hypothetical protein
LKETKGYEEKIEILKGMEADQRDNRNFEDI